MAAPDPEQVNFLIENLGKIITGLVVALLALLQRLGRPKEAERAKECLISPPVTEDRLKREMAELQLTLSNQIADNHKEYMEGVNVIHKRMTDHVEEHHTTGK